MGEPNDNGHSNGNGSAWKVLVPIGTLLLGGSAATIARDDTRERVIALEVKLDGMDKKLDKFMDETKDKKGHK